MISVHEARRWPFTGRKEDRAGGSAWNFPVPRGFNDSELGYLMSEAILPSAQDFEPEIVFIQGGADGLLEDPLSRLALSNRALWETVAVLADWRPARSLSEGADIIPGRSAVAGPVSYTHLRAHETKANLVCRLLLEKKKKKE